MSRSPVLTKVQFWSLSSSLGNYLSYHTFSSADIQRDSISKHLDSFNNLSSNLETSVISSSTGLPGPLAY